MSDHTEHITIDAWSADCIERECEHIDEDGMPDDLSACPSFPMEVCVDCQVERGLTSDPAWWEGALSPWPCEFVPEPATRDLARAALLAALTPDGQEKNR